MSASALASASGPQEKGTALSELKITCLLILGLTITHNLKQTQSHFAKRINIISLTLMLEPFQVNDNSESWSSRNAMLGVGLSNLFAVSWSNWKISPIFNLFYLKYARQRLADEACGWSLGPPLRAKLRADCLIWWKTRNGSVVFSFGAHFVDFYLNYSKSVCLRQHFQNLVILR